MFRLRFPVATTSFASVTAAVSVARSAAPVVLPTTSLATELPQMLNRWLGSVRYNKNHLRKDIDRRQAFAQYELKRTALKMVRNNLALPAEARKDAMIALQKIPRKASLARVRNRCVLTNRQRGVYRHFRLSRIQLRQLSSEGKLLGMRKSSW